MRNKTNIIRKVIFLIGALFVYTSSYAQSVQWVENIESNNFSSPCGVFVADNTIFVTNEGGDVSMFDLTTKNYIGSLDHANLGNPSDIVIHNGIIYITESTSEVEYFSLATKNYIGNFSNVALDEGVGIAIHNGVIYVADEGGADVDYFNLVTKAYIGSFGSGDLSAPSGIAIANNTIFVSDEVGKIVMYDVTTKIKTGEFGSTELDFAGGIAIRSGIIFVTDENSDDVSMFWLSNQNFIDSFGKTEFDDGAGPCHIGFGNGLIFIPAEEDNFVAIYRFPINLIPTLSQWGIILLGMILAIFGIVAVRQRKIRLAF